MLNELEVDHLAAVATHAARDRSIACKLRKGIAWGIGHTLTLLAFGGAMLLLGAVVDDRTAALVPSPTDEGGRYPSE